MTAPMPRDAATCRVLAAARQVEPDPQAVLRWFYCDPIEQCGGATADALVMAGEAAQVLAFLEAIAGTTAEAEPHG